MGRTSNEGRACAAVALGLAGAMGLGGSGCTQAKESPAPIAQHDWKADWKSQLAELPQRARSGGREVALSELLREARPVPVRGRFEFSAGGVLATAYLEPDARGLALVRHVSGASGEAGEKTYAPLRAKGQEGQWLRGEGVEVLGVKGGIAVLEATSGVDGIPSSTWTLYERARTASLPR